MVATRKTKLVGKFSSSLDFFCVRYWSNEDQVHGWFRKSQCQIIFMCKTHFVSWYTCTSVVPQRVALKNFVLKLFPELKYYILCKKLTKFQFHIDQKCSITFHSVDKYVASYIFSIWCKINLYRKKMHTLKNQCGI